MCFIRLLLCLLPLNDDTGSVLLVLIVGLLSWRRTSTWIGLRSPAVINLVRSITPFLASPKSLRVTRMTSALAAATVETFGRKSPLNYHGKKTKTKPQQTQTSLFHKTCKSICCSVARRLRWHQTLTPWPTLCRRRWCRAVSSAFWAPHPDHRDPG